MYFLRIFILFGFCSLAYAEHKTEPNQVYNRSSQLTVDNINKVTELFRDPTKLSGNFRQVLKDLKPKTATDASTTGAIVPQIKLIGKVFEPKISTVLALSDINLSSVVLDIEGQVLHLKEGAMSSVVKQEHLISIRVEEITQNYVKLNIQPGNETMILH